MGGSATHDTIVESSRWWRVLRNAMRALTIWPLAAALAALACSSSSGPQTPPALVNVFWVAGGQRTLVWTSSQPDGGLVVVAAPALAQVDFVFDQRMDGAKIEDAATPPVTVTWPDQTAPFAYDVQYNSEPIYGGSTSYAFVKPATVGVPSSQSITFTLDAAALTGSNNQPFVGPTQIDVTTGPIAAAVRVPSDAGGLVPAVYPVPIAFSNRVAADAVTPYVHATTAAGPVEVTVAGNASDPTLLYVTAACESGWPAGVPDHGDHRRRRARRLRRPASSAGQRHLHRGGHHGNRLRRRLLTRQRIRARTPGRSRHERRPSCRPCRPGARARWTPTPSRSPPGRRG